MSRYIDLDKIQFVIGTDAETGEKVMLATMNQIEEIPTTDVVEVRHGKWIWKFNLDGDDFYECSICDRQEVINGLCREKNPAEHFPYCHCGAKMDGERRVECSSN